MPTGIYKRKPFTQERKDNIAKSMFGKKRKPFTQKTKDKMREAKLGTTQTQEHKDNISKANSGENHPMFGKKHKPESIEKMKEAKAGEKHNQWGKKLSQETKDKMRKAHLGEKSKSWKGNNVGYAGKHYRIVNLKGKASKHLCVDCGKQAHDWSNVDHLYSFNPDDYQPRCRCCHIKYDKLLNNNTVQTSTVGSDGDGDILV